MSTSSFNNKEKSNKIKITFDISKLCNKLVEYENARMRTLFESILLESKQIDTINLWEQNELAISYWILLLNGIDQEEEKQIAMTLLQWKEFYAKHLALVRCLQSSDIEFSLYSSRFQIDQFPSLILSDSPIMQNVIVFDPLEFNKKGKNFRTFLTRINQMILNGKKLCEIERGLQQEKAWCGIKLVYKELKSWFAKSK
jgi:hypothetical protein